MLQSWLEDRMRSVYVHEAAVKKIRSKNSNSMVGADEKKRLGVHGNGCQGFQTGQSN